MSRHRGRVAVAGSSWWHDDAGRVAVGQRDVVRRAFCALGGNGVNAGSLGHDEGRVDGCR